MEAEILFHAPFSTGLTGVVDSQNAVLHGVALIHSEIEADGHNLWIDKTLLKQLSALGAEKGQIPCNIDHSSGSSSTIGFIDGFRIDGKVLRGDLHLLKTHSETPTLLEKAERMPGGVGLSAAFKGPPQGVKINGKQCARAEKLLSFDLVTRPAAAPNGLFSAKEVDSANKSQMDTPAGQQKEPTLAEVMEAIGKLSTRVDQFGQLQDQIVGHLNSQAEEGALSGDDRAILESLYNATDEQLAAQGLTRAEVDAAVSEYNASVGAEGAQGEGEGQGEDAGELAGAGANGSGGGVEGASAGAGAPAVSMAALSKRLVQLEAKLAAKEKAEKDAAELVQFQAVEQKMLTLAEQRDKLKEFSENLTAENEALRLAVRTGTRPVKAGVDNGVRLFAANQDGQLHQFQQNVKRIMTEKKCTEGAAIQFAIKEPNGEALHADWLQSLQGTIHA